MGGMSVFAQGGYLTLVQRNAEAAKRRGKDQQRQLQWTLQLLYVNSYNTLPFFVLVSILLGEPAKIAHYNMKNGKNKNGLWPLRAVLIRRISCRPWFLVSFYNSGSLRMRVNLLTIPVRSRLLSFDHLFGWRGQICPSNNHRLFHLWRSSL